ncbi:MAG: hypothetical protein JOZ75_10330 [Candidatus Dormibacteraeota bacterium]|nr:hypothetical protein [Candidatus Dormibacteraeota bacterium]
MTAFELAVAAAVTLAAGVVLVSWVTAPLTLVERVLIAVVAGMLVGGAATYGLALLTGLHDWNVLCGPVLVAAAGLVPVVFGRNPLRPWLESIRAARAFWAEHPRTAWLALGIGLAGAAIVTLIFARTLSLGDGALQSGYATVWADWSQHLTTAASFAVAANLPPVNPLFSGTPLLYPFLADFQSASLIAIGASVPAALAVPSGVLVFVGGALVVGLARRLGVGLGGGVAAALIVFLGGGIGFLTLFPDACAAHGFPAAQCSFSYILSHPAQGVGIIGGTLHELPGTVMAQPRAYDGLPSDGATGTIAGLEWYTPLLAWWLPQRTIVYGFAAAVAVLVLVYAGLRSETRSWSPFVLAGLLAGLLPIVHIQTLIALAIILVIVAGMNVRREWTALLVIALVIALPRLVQVAMTGHGSAATGNQYPWLEPGWLAASPDRLDITPVNTLVATGQAVRQLVNPVWWGFWAANLGLVVPLCAVLVIAGFATLVPGRTGAVAQRIVGVVPRPLFGLFIAAMVVFALCNVVVFQSWDWDNTKLLVYWYLVAGLVAGALLTASWPHLWRTVAASLLLVSIVLTGSVVMLRFGPWTPPADQVGGPFVIADKEELALAETIISSTPPRAVFLTFGVPNDPLLTVAGRTSVLGYYGWLWSYGTVFGTRQADVQAMYQGCAAAATDCGVYTLLRQYHVSYVEIDDRVNAPGAVTQTVGFSWWASQGLPVVAHTSHIVVYDVRGVA